MLCTDGRMQQYYLLICGWTTNNVENNHLRSVNLPYYPVSSVLILSFADGNLTSWQFWHNPLHVYMIILSTQGDETRTGEVWHHLDEKVVGTTKSNISNMKCISETTSIVPDIQHTIDLDMLNHLMHRVTSILEQHPRIDSCKQLFMILSLCPGFARCNTPYSQVNTLSGKVMQALRCITVPDFSMTLSNRCAWQMILFTEVLMYIINFRSSHHMI